MDTSISISETGEGPLAMLAKPAASRPTLTLPPRSPADSFFKPSDTTTPSPMTFVSSLFADNDPYADYKSFSQLLAGAMGSPGVRFGGGLGEPEGPTNTNQGTDEGVEGSQALSSQGVGVSSSSGQVIPSPARANTAKFKSMMPSRLPIPRSPYLTIPPGLSPTTLLDSPVLVSMGQILSSPTTGTFPLPPFSHDVTALGHEGSKDNSDGSSNFVFRPHPQLPLSPLASMGPFGLSHQQALAQVHAQAQSQAVPNSSAVDTSVFECKPLVSSAQKLPVVLEETIERPAVPTGEPLEKVSSSHLSAPPLPPPHLVERPSEDGYNWRKYGQKQVKGSEYPRSYYKCTYANCPVKKKVERSYDGHITEIVYKGDHSHTKPQSTRRGGSNPTDIVGRETSHASAVEGAENSFGLGTVDGDKLPLDASCTVRGPYSGGIMATPEPSLGSLSEDELEDGDAVRGEDGGDDETDSKRRRIEKARESLVNPPLRTIREPRVVVQTTSEVDILDDGYRWRKYGQKVVKGNPHPRSYYKCTNVGCSVRKHVERSSTDVTAVITTYEGKHNHDVPAARNSSHDTSTAAAVAPPPASTGQGLSSAKIIPKPVPSLQEQVFGGFGSSALMHNAMMSNENVSHLGPDMSVRNMVSSSLIGAMPHRESDFFSQDATLKPKQEPGDAHPVGSSLQPVYQSNSSSLVTQRLSY